MAKMNKELEKIRVIEPGAPDGEFYFQSLIEQAQSKGLLSESEVERLQYECLALLAKKAERYNSGFSSSIPVETAQSMMASVLFTIGVWLKTCPTPDDAVTALKNESVDELYQQGRERINKLLASAKTLHQDLLRHIAKVKNVFYRATVEGDISGFFKLYDPDYAAQEIHITADYPTCLPVPKLAGIEFITAYLNRLYIENAFCLRFAPEGIHHLMCGFSEEYEELLINVFEPVLTAAIGCVLAGTDPHRLDISGGEMTLYRKFDRLPDQEILARIRTSVQMLKRVFGFSPQMDRYIKSCLPLIAEKIKEATDKQHLDKIFFKPDFPENKPVMIYSFGEKMDDEKYRSVIKRIARCNSSEEKSAIIKKEVHSLADLEDVLLDADLTGEEVTDVLGGVGLPEIAALSKRYQIKSDTDEFELRQQQQFLKSCLQDFLSKMPPNQQEMIDKAMEIIKEE